MNARWQLAPLQSSDTSWIKEWTTVWRATEANHPLLAPQFAQGLIESYPEPQLHLARYSGEGRTEILALMHPSGPLGWSIFQPSQAPLPMLVGAFQGDTNQLLNSLVATSGALLLAVPTQDPDFTLLPREQLDNRAGTLDYATTITIVATDGFEAFWQSRKKKLRDNVKRYFKKVTESGKECRLEVLTQVGDMAQGVRDYGDLESAGWKGQAGTAIHGDNHQGMFYTKLMQAFAAEDNARVLHLYFDEQRVASRLAIVGPGQAVFLKTTYDEALKKVAPGRLMLYRALEHLLDVENLKRIEFYTKANQDMRQWGSQERTLYHVNAYRWPIVGQLHSALAATKKKLFKQAS